MPWHGSNINNDSTQNESTGIYTVTHAARLNQINWYCNEAEELRSTWLIGLVLVVFNELEDEEKWWLHAVSSSLLVQIYKVAKKIEMIQ